MKKKVLSLHDMAIRLCEGGVVEFGGIYIRAEEYHENNLQCYDCKMDCICSSDMKDLCAECDFLTNSCYLLKLANEQ